MTRRRLRILSLIPDLGFGGSQSRLLSFATTVDRDRFEHVVAVLHRTEAEFEQRVGALAPTYRRAGVEVIDLGSPPRQHLTRGLVSLPTAAARALWVLGRLAALVRSRGIDVIDAHHGAASVFGVAAGRLTQRPVTITQYFIDYWDRPLMRRLAQRVFPGAAAFICDSQYQSDAINRWLGHAHPRSVVIPNGVPRPVAERSPVEMRRLLGIPVDPRVRVVGQVGRLVPFKGQRVLIEAATIVTARCPDVFFLITGFSPRGPAYRMSLERAVVKAGLADKVRIVSYPGPIGDVWAAIDIHVHPTLRDSLPIAIAEGMSLAKPAVVTAVSGIPEMVEHDRTGLIIPPDDVPALASAVLALLEDPDRARALGAAARERYDVRYRPRTMAESLQDLFADIVAAAPRPAMAPGPRSARCRA